MNTPRKRAVRARVVLAERALADLRAIENHSVHEWGRKTADRYLDALAAAFDRLRENPEILHLEPDLAPGLYFYRVQKHVLVCDFRENIVHVLTLLHTSMDLPTRLSELEPRLIEEVRLLQKD